MPAPRAHRAATIILKDGMHTTAYLVPVVWIVKTVAYWGIFRIRTIPVTVLTCLIIAGAPLLLGIVPLPSFLSYPATIALAVYLTMHYTGVDLIPDGLFIPLGVEVACTAVLWLLSS